MGSVVLRGVLLGIVAAASLLGASGAALASTGCTAFNGGYAGQAYSGSTQGTTFAAGDTITLTITAVGGADRLGLYNDTTHNPLIMSFDTVGTQSYVVPAATSNTFIVSGTQSNINSTFTWSCVAGGGTTGGTDSENLGTVQSAGSSAVATTSTSSITGSVTQQIDKALAGPAACGTGRGSRDEFIEHMLSTAGTKGLSANSRANLRDSYGREYDAWTQTGMPKGSCSVGSADAEPSNGYFPEVQSEASRLIDDAFEAIDVAPAFEPKWSPWADVRAAGSASNVLSGVQVNLLAGITYKASSETVFGAFVGYETFSYDFSSFTGRLKGAGGTLGTYAGWQITPTLRWSGMLGWTGLGYDTTAGAAAGNFGGSRLMLSSGLTGNIAVDDYVVEPSAEILALWESQTAYTDTLAVAHDARGFGNARVAVGGKVIAQQWADVFTPYVGVYGDWRFSSGSGDGLSARVTGGVTVPVLTHGSLSLGAEYGGIGTSAKLWTGNARLTVPF